MKCLRSKKRQNLLITTTDLRGESGRQQGHESLQSAHEEGLDAVCQGISVFECRKHGIYERAVDKYVDNNVLLGVLAQHEEREIEERWSKGG